MAELLLLNPRRRRRAAKKAKRKARRRNPIAARRPSISAVDRRRRRNPFAAVARRRRRRRNPISGAVGRLSRVGAVGRRRRRRNPIMGGNLVSGFVKMVQGAAIGAAGAIAVDLAMGQINRFLPATMQRVPGKVGVGDAVKALITVVLGRALDRPTKGLAGKMAQGALTVQAHQIMAGFVPPALQLGYLVPGRVIDASARVGPMQVRRGMNAYVPAGTPTPLLNGVGAYTRTGVTPLLSGMGARSARMREGAVR